MYVWMCDCICLYIYVCGCVFVFFIVYMYRKKMCVKKKHKVIGHHMCVINILVCDTYHNVQYYNRLDVC